MPWLAKYAGADGWPKCKGIFEDKDDALDCLDQMEMRPEEYPRAHLEWSDMKGMLTLGKVRKLFDECSEAWK